jgi:hypothetical protein
MATNDPKQPSILDSIINGSYDPVGVGTNVPAPLLPALSSAPAASTVPSALKPALSSTPNASTVPPAPAIKAPAPTLGTQAQFTAPSDNAQPAPDAEGTWSSDGKTLTLPPRTAENSSTPLSPDEHVGILKTIGRLAAGATGFESPNSSPQASLGAKIGGLIGRIGIAGALAAGTPEQRAAAIEQEKIPLQTQLAQNEMQYRRDLTGNNAAKTAEMARKDQAAEALKQQNIDRQYRIEGMIPDENRPGMHRPMTGDEILSDPALSKNQDMKSAAIAVHNADAAYADARRDALLSPGSLTQQNLLKEREMIKYKADATMALAGARLRMSQQNQSRENQEFLLNYGQSAPGAGSAPSGAPGGSPIAPTTAPVNGGRPSGPSNQNPQGLNLDNAPDMMLVNPATGLPIPMKMLSALKPTQQENNRADFAASAMHSADKVGQLVEQAKAQVGPFAGRTAELMAKAGLGDQFNQELQNYIRFTQSAATAAHTGRFSVPILDKMDKMIGPEMNPDQLTGAIDSIKSQMARYADAGWKPTVVEYRAWLGGTGTTPSGAKATPNSPGGGKLTPAQYLAQKKAGR